MANLARIAQLTDVAFEWLATGRGRERPKTDDGPPAIDADAIAVNLFEERLLRIARKLPLPLQEPLLEFLAALVKRR